VKALRSPIVYAFIDSQNLNLGVRSAGWELDFGKFFIYLKEKLSINKSYLFIGKVEGKEKLYKYLENCGYCVIYKPTLKFKNKKGIRIKGNVDAELVLQVMIEWKNFDKAVLVSGDGDFYCLTHYLHHSNKLEKILVPNKNYSSLLRKFANKIVSVEQLRDKVGKKP
jgi:uncharacterized LabA/DUF88 family protein